MSIPFKKSPIEFNQRLLFPSNIFDLPLMIMNATCIKTYSTSLTPPVWKVSTARKGNAYHPLLIAATENQVVFQYKILLQQLLNPKVTNKAA